MLKKTRIAMLVAGALFAAQTGAVLGQSDDAIWLDESSSSSGPQQLTVFNPEGSSYSMTPVEIQVAMEFDEIQVAMESDEIQVAMASDASGSAESSVPEQVSVFHPDGLAYSITPVEVQIAMVEPDLPEPTLLVTADESLPQQLTVFEPSGLSYSYEFTPLDVTMLEFIDVIAMESDISIEPVALIDEDADLRPTYEAHFVSPPSYTGILEETLS